MVSPYPRRWLVLKSLLWRKRMRTVSPEHAEWDTIQKMASLWGHQKCPASLTSASPVLGFVCNRSKHLHKPKDYFPKLTCLLSSFGKNTTPRWSCVWRSHWQKKYPVITLSLFHIQRGCTECFPRPKHSWRCKNTWKIWNQVQSLYLCICCPTKNGQKWTILCQLLQFLCYALKCQKSVSHSVTSRGIFCQ